MGDQSQSGGVLLSGASPVYSVDTSALVRLCDTYRPDVFMSVWRFVEELVDDRRLFASEEVKEEASNPELVDLFTRKPEMVVDLASVQLYVNRFIIESAQAGLLLNDPNNPDKNLSLIHI